MQCSNCGMCCESTEMLLSKEDIERLERLGFSREDFTVSGGDGLIALSNVGEWCYFYDPEEKKCARARAIRARMVKRISV